MFSHVTFSSMMSVTEPEGTLTSHWLPLGIGMLGMFASIVLLFSSTGSNDIQTWHRFATEIQTSGLLQLYEADALFNHPPLMGILAWQLLEISSLLGAPFSIVFKLVPVLANVAAAVLLGVMWWKKAGLSSGMWAFALFNWALCSVLVAAYHGNTDCLCAFFCLVSLYCLERGRPGFAGLMIAGAINVKIIPLLLIFPMFAAIRTMRGIWQFCLGATVGTVPFMIAWAGAGSAFVSNVFGYGSSMQAWGIQWLLPHLTLLPGMTIHLYEELASGYNTIGKIAIVNSVLLLSVFGYSRRWDPARLMAGAFALFLLLTPGFGVQYVAYLTPLIFAVDLRWGFIYALVSGVFIGYVYIHFLVDVYPLESFHIAPFSPTAALLGFIVWCLILCFLWSCLRYGLGENSNSRMLPSRADRGNGGEE